MNLRNTEDDLRKRVEGMLEARNNGYWDDVYDYYNKEYRDSITKKQFMNRPRGLRFIAYDIQVIEIQPSKTQAKVTIREEVSYKGRKTKGQITTDWIIEEGRWVQKIDPKRQMNPIVSPENK
ncbi:hypothetical protein QUF76_02790 [Desulfobacterales bacterium HSG16]|nr:hypothetical protein [Desulfobacterales bacterium HSG16]